MGFSNISCFSPWASQTKNPLFQPIGKLCIRLQRFAKQFIHGIILLQKPPQYFILLVGGGCLTIFRSVVFEHRVRSSQLANAWPQLLS